MQHTAISPDSYSIMEYRTKILNENGRAKAFWTKNRKLIAVKIYTYIGSHLQVITSQCAPGFPNPNQKVHGIFHFYIAGMYKKDQN